MSDERKQPSFRPPNQVAPPPGAMEADPIQVRKWLEELPVANVRETTRQVYLALQRINAYAIAPTERLKILEQFRPIYIAIAESLRKHFVHQSFPLQEKNQKVFDLVQDITGYMAAGYRSIIADTLKKREARIDGKLLATAIHRNLRFLGFILLRCYQAYSPYPAGIWKEVHQLYGFAEQNKLNRYPVADDSLEDKACSITTLYIRILLMSLASPYRLRHGEAELVDRRLEAWAAQASLLPFQRESEAVFAVALNQDSPPGYRDLLKDTEANAKYIRLLDTAALQKQVEAEHERASATRTSALSLGEMSANLLQRLLVAWGPMPTRDSNRLNIRSEVQVCTGLNAIHHFLSEEAARRRKVIDFEQGKRKLNENPGSEDSASGLSLSLEDIDGYQDLQREDTDLFSEQLRLASEKNSQQNIKLQRWRMVNVSAGGYCLQWQDDENAKLHIGEIIGIRKPDDEQWSIGVIRWMQTETNGDLKIGVQLIATQAMAVEARYCKNERDCGGDPVKALLIPENPASGAPSTLITPGHPFHQDALATLSHDDSDYYVRLDEVIENTGNFTQFRFHKQGEVVTPLNRSFKAPRQADQDDDTVWSII